MELDTTRRAVRWKYGYLTRAPQEEGARTRTPKRVRACPGAPKSVTTRVLYDFFEKVVRARSTYRS